MSAALQTGRAFVFGVTGDVTFTGIGTNADQLVKSTTWNEDSTKHYLMDGGGEVVGIASVNKIQRLTVDLIPVAASAANTYANAKTSMEAPAVMSKVTLSNFEEGDTNQVNGDWIYEGGAEVVQTAGDQAALRLPLVRYVTSTETATSLTTAVS